MPRVGISEAQVAQAVAELVAQGLTPTAASVRSRLGTGSMTTILNHLSSLREQQTPPAPVSLPEPLARALADEIARAHMEGGERAASAEARATQEAQEMAAENDRLTDALDARQESLGAALSRVTQLEQQIHDLSSRHAAEVASLREQIDRTATRASDAEAKTTAAIQGQARAEALLSVAERNVLAAEQRERTAREEGARREAAARGEASERESTALLKVEAAREAQAKAEALAAQAQAEAQKALAEATAARRAEAEAKQREAQTLAQSEKRESVQAETLSKALAAIRKAEQAPTAKPTPPSTTPATATA